MVNVWVTDWALNSFGILKHKNIFTYQEYRTKIRPLANKLKGGLPSPHTELQISKNFGPANSHFGLIIDGYKLKWHQIGNGKIQLRSCVAFINGEFFLCRAYVKSGKPQEYRELAAFRDEVDNIRKNNFSTRGQL